MRISFVMKSLSFSVCSRAPARLAATSLAVLAVFPVLAQSQVSSALKEVVVTATRMEQPLSDLVADVSIIDRAQIERSGAVGFADLIGRMPGVEFQRNGGPGNTTGVFVRGSESRFTAVFIDGVRIDSQSTGGASWEGIPMGQIDRIEILRGPAAAVYGSDALGGAIQIFTRRGEGGFTPYVGLGFGTYGTRRADAGFSGAGGAFDYSLGLVDEQSDGYNARTIASQNPDLDGYRSRSASLKLGFQIDAAHRLDASYLSNNVDSQYDSGLGRDDRNLRDLSLGGLSWTAQWTPAWSSRMSYSESRDRYETTPSPYLTSTELRNYLLHNEVRLGEHILSADLERREDHLENAPINQTRTQDGLALGYGYVHQQHTVQLNVRHDNDSEFGGQNTASAAYGFAITPQWRATASVGSAYRAPTLYQRFSIYGVASLTPETARNAELGLRYSQGSTSLGVVVYQNKVENLITFSSPGPCGSSFGCYANTARAQYSGVTFTGTYKWADIQLGASLDLQNPRDETASKQLARRAKQHGVVTADTRVGNWTLGAEVQFSGERFDNVDNKVVLAGYSLFNLSASTAIAQDWTLQARVDNLADAQYELARTYATAGRSFYVGVKWAPR